MIYNLILFFHKPAAEERFSVVGHEQGPRGIFPCFAKGYSNG